MLKYFKFIVLAALMYMPIFGHLDTLPIRDWDEARIAINAYDMLNNGNYIVTYFEGYPDLYNTKPPLLIWFQVFFMKFIGPNELAIRLPSAIAAFLTCLVLLVLSIKYLKSFWFGFIAIFVLITSNGYIGLHAARTGDYEALLTLLTTLSGLLFFAFCETEKYRYLYGFFISTALAVLTKSVAGLFFLPAIFIYSILQKQFVPLLRSKHFYFGSVIFLVMVIGYYLLREASFHGYIAAVIRNELSGRYLETIEKHDYGFLYYFHNFIDLRLSPWHIIVPCGMITGLLIKDAKINRIALFSSVMVITYFLIISTAQTKLSWYDVPLYPFLAILTATFIYYIFQLLEKNKAINQSLAINVAPYLFLFLLGIGPYQVIFDKTQSPTKNDPAGGYYEIGYYLRDAVNGKFDLSNQYLLFEGYNVQNLFYMKILNEKGVRIAFKDWTKLDEGDVVIAYQNNLKYYVAKNYRCDTIKIKGNIITYSIHGRE